MYYQNHYFPRGYPFGQPNYLYTNPYPSRQQPVRGQATWTEGGQVTQCGIPWSDNQYMTVAVGENTPYQCGQTLKVKNLANQREVVVEVVDQVIGYPPNRINLHRRAFEALGASPGIGVLNVEITPSPELEEEQWGKYLLGVVQTAYPNYNVTDYQSAGKTSISANQVKETYNYVLQSQQEMIKVQGNVIYNPNTDRVVSFDLTEL